MLGQQEIPWLSASLQALHQHSVCLLGVAHRLQLCGPRVIQGRQLNANTSRAQEAEELQPIGAERGLEWVSTKLGGYY